jgi:hypothetical protein
MLLSHVIYQTLQTYFETNLKKRCSDGQRKKMLLKDLQIHTLLFEKMPEDDVSSYLFCIDLRYCKSLFASS